MPYRKVLFANGQYYHVFNRGVGKMQIFLNSFDYRRFLKTAYFYQLDGVKPRFSLFHPTTSKLDDSKKIVEIIAYCFMPNHFHFLLRQEKDGGIVELIRKLCNSYAKYFNTKNDRVGSLFQGEFRAVHVTNDEQLIHLSRYIHLNPLVNNIVSDLSFYRWSSYGEYVGLSKGKCATDAVLGFFKSADAYQKFIYDQVGYAKELESIKHLQID